jgi:putative hydrolase of the HAD superfamily
MSNVRAILFDLDETLTDRSSSIAKMCELLVKRFSTGFGDLNFHDLCRRVINADRHGYRPRDEFFAELCDMFSRDERPSAVQVAEFWQAEFPGCAVERGHATQTLQVLLKRGFLLGMITNGRAASQNAKIDCLKLREYFSTIIISEAVGVKKPDPKIFNHALSNLKIEPFEAAFVGDHPLNDIAGSQSMGMKSVWLRGSHEWPSDIPQPQFYADSLPEVLTLFEQAML